jgi:flagellar hook-length control protein FliK
MAVAVQTWHSNQSAQSSASSSNAEKTANEDAFEKKLATAKKKHAVVSKTIVIEPPKKAAVKPVAGKAPTDEATTDESEKAAEQDQPAEDAVAKTEAENIVPTPPAKPASSGKAKQSAAPDSNSSESPAQAVRSAVHEPIAQIDPEAGNGQSKQSRTPKSKASLPANRSDLPVSAANAPPQPVITAAANGSKDDSASSDASDASDQSAAQAATVAPVSAEQLAEQPTFGTAAANGQQDGSSASAAGQTGSSSDGDATDDAATGSAASTSAFAGAIADAVASVGHSTASAGHAGPAASPADIVAGLPTPAGASPQPGQSAKAVANVATSAQARFVDENHPKIVTGISGQLMPRGGTMQLRLDPPGLGAMQVTVRMRDGSMTAAFETSNDEATRQLSHTLGQLKTSLEAAGMSVEKLHVEQAPKNDSQSKGDSDSHTAPNEQQQQAQQEKQRREMMQRMWAKLAGTDPLDMVA